MRFFSLVLLLAFASALFSAADAAVYRDRSAMETAFGYLQDVYFYLLGTGTPGNYYHFPENFLTQQIIDNYPEFVVNPLLMSNSYIFGYDLYAVGNTVLSRSKGGFYSNVFQFSSFNTNFATALGFYLDTAPLSPPAVGESMVYAFDYTQRGTIPFNSGDFIGATDIPFTPGNKYVRWNGAHSGLDEFAAISHLVSEPGYFAAGGDPHLLAHNVRSEMSIARVGDIFQLVDHPEVEVNAAIREFDFLPASMKENNFFGTVGIQLSNGDRLLISAFEEDGQAQYSVVHNDRDLTEGSSVHGQGYSVLYGQFEDFPLSGQKESFFQREFPFQKHNAYVRVLVPHQIVIDVSLSSNDHFVDWRRSEPLVIEQTGAFLNINTRDLISPAPTGGLLARIAQVHDQFGGLHNAINQLEETLAGDRQMGARSPSDIAALLEEHHSRLENFHLQERADQVVREHLVTELFSN